MRDKIRVGVLGATGAVGQRFVELLADHPYFELSALAASDASAGRRYADACRWMLSADMPPQVIDMVVCETAPGIDCDLVFSALPGTPAGPVEEAFAGAGYGVFSNASAHRRDPDVPLLIPEVNPGHLSLVATQRDTRGWERGFIVTNPNCSAVVLTMALAPIHAAFGVRSVVVNTMQGLSGAGYPGVPSLDSLDNVIPFIGGEEDKLSFEPRRMLGKVKEGSVEPADFAISAHCNRVPAREGHLETVSVSLVEQVTPEQLIEAWRSWHPLPQQLNLHSAPQPPIVVRPEPDRPQTRLDRDAGRGMAVSIGRVRPCEVFDIKFLALGHNTIRGAAGASVLNAELMLAQGMINV
ncbi:MAG: aspartate-semialdehyde dehydrogenase [Anaerolineales bacterium]|nr:MAG: aspartate-semialdehyde dehydrogenase [Anaerolineales bacterium]